MGNYFTTNVETDVPKHYLEAARAYCEGAK
jgi:hypothetical protein